MFDVRGSIDKCLSYLGRRLDPIIQDRLGGVLNGLPWTAVLIELDRIRGFVNSDYDQRDLQAQLRVLTERLGKLGFPLDTTDRLVSTLGSELRIIRNRFAHFSDLSTLDAWRTHDFAVRLLEHFGDIEGAGNLEEKSRAALMAVVMESGLDQVNFRTNIEESSRKVNIVLPAGANSAEDELITPDAEVFHRRVDVDATLVGSDRQEFQSWHVVQAGDIEVLNDLPKKYAKEHVRAVAAEIADFEGPIHLDRLTRLTAASFGLVRLHAARAGKIKRQVSQCGLHIDSDNYVWPAGVDPSTWTEFRPNNSCADRDFSEISPREISNAFAFIQETRPDLARADQEAMLLRTFGRKRRTQGLEKHLKRGLANV